MTELEMWRGLRAAATVVREERRARQAGCQHPAVTMTPDLSPPSLWAMSQPIETWHGRTHDVECQHCQAHWEERR
jgi:hypothetical protein